MDTQKSKWGVRFVLGAFGAAVIGVLGVLMARNVGGLVGVFVGTILGVWLADKLTRTEE